MIEDMMILDFPTRSFAKIFNNKGPCREVPPEKDPDGSVEFEGGLRGKYENLERSANVGEQDKSRSGPGSLEKVVSGYD